MNTKISLTKTFKNNDHLLILADKDDFSRTDGFLRALELKLLKSTTGQDAPDALVPQRNRGITAQFLTNPDRESCDEEAASITEHGTLSLLAHYPTKASSAITRRQSNRVIGFLEGMIIDFAARTGAVARACGQEAIVYMSNVRKRIRKSGRNVCERLIEFLLWREYGEQIKSNIADL